MQQIAPKTPRLPDQIEKSASEGRLIIFLGAGISCAVGLPTWDSVKNDLIDQVNLPSDLKDELRNMETYSCFEAVYRHNPETYSRILDSALSTNGASRDEFRRLLKVFGSLKPASIVTTNVDDLLRDCGIFTADQFRYMEECAPQELRDDKVFCLHGNREKHVFNTYDTKLYDCSHFKSFLNNVFGSYCVLFVGFSFRDRKLLECAKLNPEFGRKHDKYPRHFALLDSKHEKPPSWEPRQDYGIHVFSYDNADDTYANFVPTIYSWERDKYPSEEDWSRSVI